MKRLYVINNGGAYSDNFTALVVADPDEWDNLERVLRLFADEDDEFLIEAVASEWTSENTCSPGSVVSPERFFRFVEGKQTEYFYEVPYPKELARFHHVVETRGVSAGDLRRLVRDWEAQGGELRDPNFLPLVRLALERGAFAEGEKP